MTMSRFSSCTHTHGHGSNRSWLRWIASKLPIKADNRLIIRIPTIGSPQQLEAERSDATGEFLDEPVGLNLIPQLLLESGEHVKFVGKESSVDPVESSVDPETEEEKRARAAALEAELARLKLEIARYALERMDEPVPEYLRTGAPPPPPPPPPPPLPCLPQTKMSSSTEEVHHPSVQPAADQPDMGEVLQGIGSVKLRPLQGGKSPGGTPFRPTNKQGTYDPYDPASIIREAVRRKFANPVFQDSPYRDSPDKENCSWSDASFSALSSPTAKLLF